MMPGGRTLITGASGFVGRTLVRAAQASGALGTLRLVDRTLDGLAAEGVECVEADLLAVDRLATLLAGVDRVIHLAALPGGAAQADPALSKRVNLDLPGRLLDAIVAADRPIRFVHASSIAVFGGALPALVDDDTVPRPAMVYGTHKRTAELALEQAVVDRGVDAVSLRLPGIVARPSQGAGFKSAFMSDVFRAVSAGEPYALPVSAGATTWLMSARICAENLIHAASMPLSGRRVMTLPAIRVRMADLVAAIAAVGGGSTAHISYDPDPVLEEDFGRLPELSTPLAESVGFRSDDGVNGLVRAALSGLADEAGDGA